MKSCSPNFNVTCGFVEMETAQMTKYSLHKNGDLSSISRTPWWRGTNILKKSQHWAGRGRQIWGLLPAHNSLLGKPQASGTPCFKRTRGMAPEERKPEVDLWPLHVCTHKETDVYTQQSYCLSHTHTLVPFRGHPNH